MGRTENVTITMTKNEKTFFQSEARKMGVCLSEFIRRKLYADYPHKKTYGTTKGLTCTSPMEEQEN